MSDCKWEFRIFGLWEIDLSRIPRPDRSGYASILLWATFIQLYFAPIGGDTMSLRCLLNSSACRNSEYTNEAVARHNHVIYLYPGGRGKKPCTCHMDVRFFGKEIYHIHSNVEESCDSDHFTPTEWTEPDVDFPCGFDGHESLRCVGNIRVYNPYTTNITDGTATEDNSGTHASYIELVHGKGEYRLHCDDVDRPVIKKRKR